MANRSSMGKNVARFLRSYASEILVGFFLCSFGFLVFGPTVVLADVVTPPLKEFGSFPVAGEAKPRRFMKVEVSAYTSRLGETDSTPFTTASGTRVHDGTLATNLLKFGTKVRIPALYGDKIFTVEDRMNSRYQNHADIWVEDVAMARQIGRRHLTMEVF